MSTLGQITSDPAIQALIQGVVQQAQRTGLATPQGRANAVQQTLQFVGGRPQRSLANVGPTQGLDTLKQGAADYANWRAAEAANPSPFAASAGPLGRYPLKSQGLDIVKLPNGQILKTVELERIMSGMSPESRASAVKYIHEQIIAPFEATAPPGSSFKFLTTPYPEGSYVTPRSIGRATPDKPANEALGKISEWLGGGEDRFKYGLPKPHEPDALPWTLGPRGQPKGLDWMKWAEEHPYYRKGGGDTPPPAKP